MTTRRRLPSDPSSGKSGLYNWQSKQMCRWVGAAIAGLCCLIFPIISSATILDFTFHGDVASVSLNGGAFANEPLTITLPVDTATLSIGTGFAGSNEYTNLSAFVSSAPLGLTNVEVTTPLAVEIGTPGLGPPFAGTTVLLEAGGIVNGLFGNSAIASWDDISPIGPLDFSAAASGTLSLSLSNGDTLSTPVPEPSSLLLMAAGLFALRGLGRRCRATR